MEMTDYREYFGPKVEKTYKLIFVYRNAND